MWIHLKLIKEMKNFCKDLFPVSTYGAISVPSYPCGTIGFMLCSKDFKTDFKEPLRIFSEEEKDQMNLKCYDEYTHRAAFMLPRFVKQVEIGLFITTAYFYLSLHTFPLRLLRMPME